MNKLKFSLAFALSFFFLFNQAEAQDYRLAGGVRLGYPVSLSLKYFLSESSAIEGFLGTRGYSYFAFGYRSTVVGGAYLYHSSLEIDELPGLKWYVGGGASVYLYNYDDGIIDNDRVNSSLALHVFGGLDYAFDDIPLNVSIDWSPTIIFNGLDSGFGGRYGSIGVRYILSR